MTPNSPLYKGSQVFADRFANRLAFAHLHMAAHDRIDRHALNLPAVPRARLIFAVKVVDVDDSFFVQVDNRYVSVGTKPERSFFGIDLPDLCRILRGDLDIMVECHSSFIDFGQNQGDSCLDAAESGDAVPDSRLSQLSIYVASFFFQCVWRVIRRDRIHVAVEQSIPEDLRM